MWLLGATAKQHNRPFNSEFCPFSLGTEINSQTLILKKIRKDHNLIAEAVDFHLIQQSSLKILPYL